MKNYNLFDVSCALIRELTGQAEFSEDMDMMSLCPEDTYRVSHS
jgi:hypothetical protein